MNRYRVAPDSRVHLEDHEADDTGDYKHADEARDRTAQLKQTLEALQERLYAEGARAVLVVVQGIWLPRATAD